MCFSCTRTKHIIIFLYGFVRFVFHYHLPFLHHGFHYFLITFLFPGMVSYVARDIILFPDIELFVDVMRRCLSTYGFSVGVHFRIEIITLYASIRLGHTWFNYYIIRFDKEFRRRRNRNCRVSKFINVSSFYRKCKFIISNIIHVLIVKINNLTMSRLVCLILNLPNRRMTLNCSI